MFPFDEPTPTAFYLMLYLATMVLHIVPMNYVLVGSGLLAVLAGWETVTRRPLEKHAAIAATLRDWLPLALSIAITAGVAPLLFLQILYKEPFYTANLLLLHRWMLILPVLIVAFYLLYVQKMKRVAGGPAWLRLVVSVGILGCFGFVAWAWTENHLLSLRGQATWNEQYADGGFFYGDWEVVPRLAVWCCGAIANLAMVLVWQLRGRAAEAFPAVRRLGLIGIVAGAIAAMAYGFCLDAETRGEIASRGIAYGLLAMIAYAGLTRQWLTIGRGGVVSANMLVATTVLAVAATAAMTVLRELRRLADIDISLHYSTHADAAQVGGLWLFLFFLLANAAAIGWVVAIVRRGLRA